MLFEKKLTAKDHFISGPYQVTTNVVNFNSACGVEFNLGQRSIF